MKQIIIMFAVIMTFSATVFAQDANLTLPKDFKPTTVTKTKITCSSDRLERVLSNLPEHQMQVTKGKVSESIRTTWASGDTEYRFSEFTAFTDNGTEVFSKGRSMSKVVTKIEGNQVTETIQMRQVINYVQKDTEVFGGNLQQRDNVSIAVFLVNGNERTLISAVDDGKVSPTNGAKELEIKLSDKKKVVHYTEVTPYTWEDGDFKVEVLKSEMNCLFETLD